LHGDLTTCQERKFSFFVIGEKRREARSKQNSFGKKTVLPGEKKKSCGKVDIGTENKRQTSTLVLLKKKEPKRSTTEKSVKIREKEGNTQNTRYGVQKKIQKLC